MTDSFSKCWHCGQQSGELCPSCGSLQRPPAGFYSLFGLKESLNVDTDDLQRRFYDLSRKLHPDRYTNRSELERQYSLEATALLNDGFRTLRDPVKRAEYVLKQHGIDIAEQRTKNVPPELLEEVFELNEALEEIRGGDDSVRGNLVEARERFRTMLDEIDGQLDIQFHAWDEAGDDELLGKIRGILNRRRYIQNLLSEVDKELTASHGRTAD